MATTLNNFQRRMRWYGHVLRRDDGHASRKALEFEVKGKKKRGRQKKKWKMPDGQSVLKF